MNKEPTINSAGEKNCQSNYETKQNTKLYYIAGHFAFINSKLRCNISMKYNTLLYIKKENI